MQGYLTDKELIFGEAAVGEPSPELRSLFRQNGFQPNNMAKCVLASRRFSA
jgi:hypothetical protein